MKKSLVSFLLVSSITVLSGCTNNPDNTRNNIRTADVRDNVRNNADTSDNDRLTVSERAARNVQCLTEVDRANVIIRDNIAYVTARLSDYTGRPRNYMTGKYGTNGTAGTTGAGSTIGITGAGGNIGSTESTGNGTGGVAGTGIAGSNSITAGPNGTAGMTGTRGNYNGAYSSADNVFEQRVAAQVLNADQNVKKVYISTDANLFKRMSTYSNYNGKSRDGFLRSFTNTTRGFFINR